MNSTGPIPISFTLEFSFIYETQNVYLSNNRSFLFLLEQKQALEELTVEKILSNLFLVRCHDYVELLAEVYLLPDFLSEHPEVKKMETRTTAKELG